MKITTLRSPALTGFIAVLLGSAMLLSDLGTAQAQTQIQTHSQIPAFAQAVAEAAARDEEIAAFYRTNGYKPIWTGTDESDRARRAALLNALARADDHGLPVASYDTETLRASLGQVSSQRDLGRLEVEMSRVFLLYARHIQTGIVIPREVDGGITRKVDLRDRTDLLVSFAKSTPSRFLKELAPTTGEYARLMREKLRLERLLAGDGWGKPVPVGALKPGSSGNAVIALRNRLIVMGYLDRSSTRTYDADIQRAVQVFQLDHGLNPDGVAGQGTIKHLNTPVEKRLQSIMVAMERERWMNIERGARHVWVNLVDFTAAIVDNGEVTFQTRAVVGQNTRDRRSPEFSDVMEYMEVNPSWNVPRSIATKEYLPAMMANPAAAGHLQLIDGAGRVVSRQGIDFSAYTARTFPYDLRQPPSSRNALGLVKFMFPNPHNVYLHDTPAKSLFQRDVRAFSHGCIRLHQPFDFAYALLARQSDDPVSEFQAVLKTGRLTQIKLEQPIPVHLVYRTAIMPAKGNAHYRNDVYGRDGRIFAAMLNAGVVLRSFEG
ncbi:MAG: L,D-transpeptidase family protein [Rhodobacteraceae bacterium]|nr:L,D-transpeptidase family protein [Paracoccaceae bacterium]